MINSTEGVYLLKYSVTKKTDMPALSLSLEKNKKM